LFCGKTDSGIWEGDFPAEEPVHWGNGIPHKIFPLPCYCSLPESGHVVHHVEALPWFLSGHLEEIAELQGRVK